MKTRAQTQKKHIDVNLAAIEQRRLGVGVSPTSFESGRGFYTWGENNDYPNCIYNLYLTSPTLQSIIDGTTQYIADTDDLNIDKIAFQLELYGAFAVLVDCDTTGVKFSVLDWRFLRFSTTDGYIIYSEGFGDITRKEEQLTYKLFDATKSLFDNKHSVLIGRRAAFQRYPIPPIGSALFSAESESLMARYHVAMLEHGFAGNLLVNFNNGDTSDEDKAEIERTFIRKFNGANNAGQIVFSWNNSKETATTIEPINVEDFGDKYKGLADSVRQQIFTAFRVNPNIFGLPTEGTGFSGEEYEQSFALFVRNVVNPQRALITKTLAKIGIDVTFNEIKPL